MKVTLEFTTEGWDGVRDLISDLPELDIKDKKYKLTNLQVQANGNLDHS